MMSAPAASARYLSIHYLRAVAAIMVVIYHIFSHHLVIADNPDQVAWLQRGVGIFFVISGFVMVVSTSPETRLQDFLVRRVRRIVPLYWLLTALFALSSQLTDWPYLLRSLFFLPTFYPGTGLIRLPALDVGWTLNYEMTFYGLFALATLLPRRIAIWILCLVLALLSGLAGLLDAGPLVDYYFQPFWGSFMMGMLIAHLRVRAPLAMLPIGFLLLALAPLVVDSWLLGVTLPAALIVASARSLDGRLPEWSFPMLLGDASYALYLSHLFVLLPLVGIFGSSGNPVLMLLLALSGSLTTGVALHLLVERPLARLARSGPTQQAEVLV